MGEVSGYALARIIKIQNLRSKESHLFQLWKKFQQNAIKLTIPDEDSRELQKLKMKKNERLKKRKEKDREIRAQWVLQKKKIVGQIR